MNLDLARKDIEKFEKARLGSIDKYEMWLTEESVDIHMSCSFCNIYKPGEYHMFDCVGCPVSGNCWDVNVLLDDIACEGEDKIPIALAVLIWLHQLPEYVGYKP